MLQKEKEKSQKKKKNDFGGRGSGVPVCCHVACPDSCLVVYNSDTLRHLSTGLNSHGTM